jgi:hypothetical protein
MAESKITIELVRLSDTPHGRTCAVCGAATMTSTFQFGNTALELEICEPCEGKVALIPPSPTDG